jgi:hypothetical protein
MGRIVERPLGYTSKLQNLVWTLGNNTPVVGYMWGGGGGGGGNDARLGGAGAGGSYVEFNFVVNNGDIIECAVGGGGGPGSSGSRFGPGGSAGASYVTSLIFNTITSLAPGIITYTNPNYCTFLNSYGVWVNPVSSSNFDQTYSVTFPTTGAYTIVGSCDNFGSVFIDGVNVLNMGTFTTTFTNTVNVNAGTRSVRVVGVNTGGPGCIAVTIEAPGSSFSGGNGGFTGASGTSGAGGGGGGASVAFLNGSLIACAGGGGGGGGGGRFSSGFPAPGPRPVSPSSITAGMNGEDKAGDGAGGGGGGGGYGGGPGGVTVDGDSGALGGTSGGNFSNLTAQAGTTIFPGGTSSPYYVGRTGYGGPVASFGYPGYAMFVFDVNGTYVHWNGTFNPIVNTYIKNNGEWKTVKETYIKNNGVWVPVRGGASPPFNTVNDKFGIAPRPFS